MPTTPHPPKPTVYACKNNTPTERRLGYPQQNFTQPASCITSSLFARCERGDQVRCGCAPNGHQLDEQSMPAPPEQAIRRTFHQSPLKARPGGGGAFEVRAGQTRSVSVYFNVPSRAGTGKSSITRRSKLFPDRGQGEAESLKPSRVLTTGE